MKASVLPAVAALACTLAACSPPEPFTVVTSDAQDSRFSRAQMFNSYGCTGQNVSPNVAWEGAPSSAQSFAVTIFDPDAKDHGWYHWLIVDIPASEHQLATGTGNSASLPLGMKQTKNDFGVAGYGGPCPPPGEDHHYVITVYALKVTTLGMPMMSAPADVAAKLKANEIAEAKVTVKAKR